MACEETGFGNPQDKEIKKPLCREPGLGGHPSQRTVGILREDAQQKIWDVGVPVGVIAAIVPRPIPPPPFATRP